MALQRLFFRLAPTVSRRERAFRLERGAVTLEVLPFGAATFTPHLGSAITAANRGGTLEPEGVLALRARSSRVAADHQLRNQAAWANRSGMER